MARKLTPGAIAAIVAAAAVVLLVAGGYMVSSGLNRDAITTGNSASAPNAPGRINEQPARDQGTPKKPPLQDTNVPPAGGAARSMN